MSATPDESSSHWGFAGPEDAAQYLREVLRVWVVWIAGLAVLMTNSLVVFVVGGAGVIVVMLWIVRPIQRRAEALVPRESASSADSAEVGGSTRDRALKALAYGEEPLEEAIALSGGSSAWLLARRLVLGATVIAFVIVVLESFAG